MENENKGALIQKMSFEEAKFMWVHYAQSFGAPML